MCKTDLQDSTAQENDVSNIYVFVQESFDNPSQYEKLNFVNVDKIFGHMLTSFKHYNLSLIHVHACCVCDVMCKTVSQI